MKVLIAYGTRPEAIKLYPLINEFKARGHDTFVLNTGQQRELSQDLGFTIKDDLNLNLMVQSQSLNHIVSQILNWEFVPNSGYDYVIVQGDTSTAFAVALSAFHKRIPVVHVEAGLRSGRSHNPFPEEFNRVAIDALASFHFCPTDREQMNCPKEGTSYVVGNTGIDTFMEFMDGVAPRPVFGVRKVILFTCHRRENIPHLPEIFEAIQQIANLPDTHHVIFPAHPNPLIQTIVKRFGWTCASSSVLVTKPLNYIEMIAAMKAASLIISDSGGLQEEAPLVKTPLLITRTCTERPATVNGRYGKLVGYDTGTIVRAAIEALRNPDTFNRDGISPYGDGTSAKQIVDILEAK